MSPVPATVFRQCAVASGLVTLEQIEQAEQAIRAADGVLGELTEIADERLVAKLIELGAINLWQADQLKAGRTKFNLGPYLVIDSIGQGGMGQVFKAEHKLMGRVVAVKVLPRDKCTPEAVASFHREIRTHAQLDHENLVRAYDAGHDGNVHYLVTEHVPGTDLRKFVRGRGKLTMAEAATIISQAAKGLDYAHRRGLIHRDIKPGNLLVTPTGHTKVSDLGLASFFGPSGGDDPRAGKIVGTADYLSPEQIAAPHSISPASDIYSLGCTLYYAVTGKVPYPGGTTRDKARRHCEETPLNPRLFNPAVSDEFSAVIFAMMERQPAKRIGSAAEVVRRLAPWAGESVSTTAADMNQHDAPTTLPNTAELPTLADTEPFSFDGPPDDEGSQSSQRTPSAWAAQDTQTDLARLAARAQVVPGPISAPLAAAIMAPLVLTAATLLAGLLIVALR